MAKLLSNQKAIRQAKEVAGAQQHTAIAAMEAADRERARGIAGEQASMAVWGLLGQPGTYGNQNTFTQSWENQTNVDDPTSLFDTSGVGLSQPNQALRSFGPNDPAKGSLLGTAREGILDPESYAKAVSNTAQFRIQSQRVGESEQLLNQEGPAWDMLNNSILGIINEGSALQLKDTMRKLKNQYAKGGSARRTAMFEANELMAGERAMRMRTQETWQANLALFDSIRQNADRVAAGTQSFMAGLPLVNDSYRDAMQRTAVLQIQASQLANATLMSAYDTRMTQQPVDFLNNMIKGGIKMTASIVGRAASSAAAYYTGGIAGGGGGGGDAGDSFSFGGYNPRGGGVANAGNYLQSAFDYMNSSGTPETYAGGDQSADESIADRYMSGQNPNDNWTIDRG